MFAAGAGATEERGGAGEHSWICKNEEQPAPDQAGDGRRGENHLDVTRLCVWWPNYSPKWTSWLPVRPHNSYPTMRRDFYRLKTPLLPARQGPLTHCAHTHTHTQFSFLVFTPLSTHHAVMSGVLFFFVWGFFGGFFCIFGGFVPSPTESRDGKVDTGWTLQAV